MNKKLLRSPMISLSIIYEKVVLYINPLIFVAVCGFNIKSSTIMVIHVFGIINFSKIFTETVKDTHAHTKKKKALSLDFVLSCVVISSICRAKFLIKYLQCFRVEQLQNSHGNQSQMFHDKDSRVSTEHFASFYRNFMSKHQFWLTNLIFSLDQNLRNHTMNNNF